MLAFLQKIGRALLLPIAVMPIAALFFRLGAPDLLDIPFIMAAGAAIFDNLAILFAIGIAIGLSVDQRGEAVLAAVVGYYVMLGTLSMLLLQGGYTADQEIISKLSANVLLGLIAGLVSAGTYNRFHHVHLPRLFRFFSGRRLVPILTAIFGLLFGVILFVIFPLLWTWLEWLNVWIFSWGVWGTALYGFLNRLLLPFGLHHVLNTFFWYGIGDFVNPVTDQLVHGDIPRFLNGDPTAGVYQVGFYPVMMGGLLGASLAMVLTAKNGRKLHTLGLLGSAALVSLVTGITEPVEFAFLFVAPLLFGVHALLTGASFYIANIMGLRHGFSFSAGLIDYFLNFNLAARPEEVAILAAIYFLSYFLIFFLIIEIFNLKTLGRRDPTPSEMDQMIEKASTESSGGVIHTRAVIAALGGLDNITAIEREEDGLHISVQDSSLAIESALIALGAYAVAKPSSQDILLTFGSGEELVAVEMTRLLADENAELDSDIKREASEPVSVSDPFMEARVNMFVDALGGPDNILTVESTAATRLRVKLDDPLLIDEDAIRAAGATGVMHTAESVHVLVGVKAPQYAAVMQTQLREAELE